MYGVALVKEEEGEDVARTFTHTHVEAMHAEGLHRNKAAGLPRGISMVEEAPASALKEAEGFTAVAWHLNQQHLHFATKPDPSHLPQALE
mmetsp:Transcript_62388/g.129490  ORF Transcript_62388/g.129490 Transcript_62388/m.129490 type:complete len:90 (-) Transcript_62388:3825-4094(-)